LTAKLRGATNFSFYRVDRIGSTSVSSIQLKNLVEIHSFGDDLATTLGLLSGPSG
jgi:hypothetical protein